MNKIENGYARALSGGQGMIDGLNGPIEKQTVGVQTKKERRAASAPRKAKKEVYVASEDERRAVEKAQNANRRGRGHKKRKRVPIHFEADEQLVSIVEELHFQLGRTKNELYNEALGLLVGKYENK